MNYNFCKSLFLILTFAITISTSAQNAQLANSDSAILQNYIKNFEKEEKKPIGELIVLTGEFFLNKPYVASTLESSGKEFLIINLRELDCTTFVENCIALAKMTKSGNLSEDNYKKELTNIRYRDAIIDGYTSRLHYMTDWAYNNEEKGILKNITSKIGGKSVKKEINFMSSHPQFYKHLNESPENLLGIKAIEDTINSKESYSILPISAITSSSNKIQNGDIIAFATDKKGLDYTHVAIAYWQKGELHFIHASSKLNKVVIEPKTLYDYCKSSKGCTGISIFRVNN